MFLIVGTSASGAPTPTRVHFTAAGDYGSSATSTAGVLTALAAGGSDAHFALGDLSYGVTGAEDAWCSFVKQRVGEGFPFELLSGNHESNGLNGNINDFSACLPNQLPGLVGTYGRQYYVDVPQGDPLVRFVMLSPNLGFPGGQWNYPAGSERYNWAAAAIDGARTAGVPWVVVGMHKPCLSVGDYSCDVGADLVNLLLTKKVDLVLTGHEHLYQRSKQIALRAGCPTLTIGSYNPACVADADNALTQGAGTVFAGIGTGGVGLRNINPADTEAGYFAATSGANQNPTWGYGDFDVTTDRLTMAFVRGAGGTFTDGLTITRDTTPPVNQVPVASFTSSSADLVASFDGTGSNDPDGTVVGHAWNFGDSTTGVGSSAQHTYAAAGTYSVTLTVTDNQGATGTVTHDVTVSPTSPGVLARDTFERALAAGWGSADVGGAWTLRGTASRFSVTGGAGRMDVFAGTSLAGELGSVASQSTRVTAEFSVDELGEGNYVTVVGRQVGAETYSTRLRLQADGGAKLYLLRGSGTVLGGSFTQLPPQSFVAGERYRIVHEAKGATPSQLAVKVWKVGDPEPASWLRTATDGFAGMQAAGRAGVLSYLPSSTVTGPVALSWHDITITDAG